MIEYTVLIGIVAAVGISSVLIVGNYLADSWSQLVNATSP